MISTLLLAVALGAEPELALPAPVVFSAGKAQLKDESSPVLEHVKRHLEANPAITLLRIEVHTDSRGSEQANQRLTEDRAAAVAAELVKKGVACSRLIAVGFGESRPLAPNDTAAGRASNSRTVFINAAIDGKPIDGRAVDGGGKVVQACPKPQ